MSFLGDAQRSSHPEGATFTGVLFPHEVRGGSCSIWKIDSELLVMTNVEIDIAEDSTCTVYLWTVTRNDSERGFVHIALGEKGAYFVNPSCDLASPDSQHVISLCAGMGGSILGAHAAGFRTTVACDRSALACTFLDKNFALKTIQGNLLNDETVMELHRAKGDGQHWLEAGFPCQPFSRLGDGKAWQDDRARTFEAVLKVGCHLRVRGLILECVVGASRCRELRQELESFAKAMKLQILECNQTLENYWPSKRTRWWVVLIPSHWTCGPLLDLPQIEPVPTVASLITSWPLWPKREEDQIIWTEQEKAYLRDPQYGNVNRRLDLSKPAPTALHSLGNHFNGCPCGCRQNGFREERLLAGGIHCSEIISQADGHPSRYFHPQELGILLGFPASYQYGSDMRAALCLLGQVASPLQSCWTFTQLGQFIAANEPMGSFDLLPESEIGFLLQTHSEHVKTSLQELWPLEIPSEPITCSIAFADSTQLSIRVSPGETCADFEKAQTKLEKAEFQHQLFDHCHDISSDARLQSQCYGCHKKPRISVRVPGDQDVVVSFISDGTTFEIAGKSGDFLFQFAQKLQCPLGGVADLATGCLMQLDQIIWESIGFRLMPLTFGSGPQVGFLPAMMNDSQIKHWLQIKASKPFPFVNDKGMDDVTLTYAARFLMRHTPSRGIFLFEPMEVIKWFTQYDNDLQVVQAIRKQLEFFDGHRVIVLLARDDHWALVDFCFDSYGGEATYIDGIEGRLVSEAEKIGHWLHRAVGCGPFSFTQASAYCQKMGKACGAVLLLHLGWRLDLWDSFTSSEVDDWFLALCPEIPMPKFFGGGGSSEDPATLRSWLRDFLIAKGVAPDSVDQRFEKALKLFGKAKLEQAVSTKNPWQALKALGSSMPKPFLWLNYMELQNQIQQKGTTRWGADLDIKKRSKQKARPAPIPIDKILDSNQLVLPAGHFSDGDADLPQIRVSDLRSGAKGIVVLRYEEALPFLQDGKSISTECLVLLIIGKHDITPVTALPFHYLTLPAHYAGTGEPVIVPCTAVQLGDGMVKENIDDDCPEVDTLPTAVIRFHIYKDEWPLAWEDLARRPLKNLIDQVPLLQICRSPQCQNDCGKTHLAVEEQGAESTILDIWGWKWSTNEGKKVRPSDASLAQAYFRCPESIEAPLQSASGLVGVYFEPRQSDGPGPSQDFSVIWIPGVDLKHVLHLAKTHDLVKGVARLNMRYGVKVRERDHEVLHQELCPGKPFLRGHLNALYRIEPLPVGTHRQALVALLAKWGWEAKPMQAARSSKGQAWEIGSCTPPPKDFFQHSEGYVTVTLIKDLETRAKTSEFMVPAKTRSFIQKEAKAEKTETLSTDPWTTNGDPWADFYANKGSSTVKPPSASTAPIPLPASSTAASSKIEEVESKLRNEVQASVQQEFGHF